MLPKNRRLDKSLFNEVIKKGRSIHSKNISVSILKGSEIEDSRFAFVVSKKVAKKAVNRNLMKRRGYSVLKNLSKEIKKGFLVVFFFKKGSESLTFKEIEDEIATLLKKTGTI